MIAFRAPTRTEKFFYRTGHVECLARLFEIDTYGFLRAILEPERVALCRACRENHDPGDEG